MSKLITFVVPSYNSEDYLHICVDSLLKAGEDAEILIVNDGSTDKTGEIAAAYAEKYPTIVRVLTQENGGHGEGINHGLREATGKYFKVVDSDDWVGEKALKAVIKRLKAAESHGGIDLMVCNYVYYTKGKGVTRTIRYKNVIPEKVTCEWDDVKRFRPWQYMTMHSNLYRTEILRKCGVVLPKHTFFEDNLFAYYPLPYVEKIVYLNEDFYFYLIGRENQSVSEESLKKRCDHQILVSKEIFKAHDLEKLKETKPRLVKYLYHEITFMMTLATIFTRLNRTDEAEKMISDMWKELYKHNRKMAIVVRRASIAAFVNLPGKLGRELGIIGFRFAHLIVPFN
ncbi:MAG: glycosyltransferase family 2 protein [Eubacterium sp.]|nr:glycosyltransferase family 2 protein [Eubacterium sp.]